MIERKHEHSQQRVSPTLGSAGAGCDVAVCARDMAAKRLNVSTLREAARGNVDAVDDCETCFQNVGLATPSALYAVIDVDNGGGEGTQRARRR